MASIFELSRDDFMATLPELASQGVDVDELLRGYNAQNDATAGLQGILGSPSQAIADSGRARTLGGLLSYDPNAGAGMDRVRSIGFEPRAMASDALSGILGAGQNAFNATAGRLPADDVQGAAFDAAGLVTGLGAASAGRGLLDYDPNVMRAGPLKAELDPLGYQNVKMDSYLRDTDVGITDTGVNLKRTPMSWEDMEGDFVIPFYGDRTSGGMNISSVNDIKFDRDVYTEGGLDYMRGPAAQADNAVWASNSNITKRLADAADNAALINPDRRIIGVTGSMSPDANDFATMTGGSVGEIIQQLGVPSKTAAEFDGIMRAADPNFVGVNSPNLREWLETTTSPLRKAFIRLADTKPMKDGGFPDMALGRYAVTDPTQRDIPPGMFGMGAAQIDVSAPRAFNSPKGNQPRVNVPHGTYNSIIKGDYLGSLPPVPQGLLFRDVYDRMEGNLTKAGKPLTSAHKTHAIKTIVPAQEITPQVLEGILDYIAKLQE